MKSKFSRHLRSEYYRRRSIVNTTHQMILNKLRSDYVKAAAENNESRIDQLRKLRVTYKAALEGLDKNATDKIPVS